MKKLTAIILSLALVLCAVSALADNMFTTKYYSVELPEGWETDTENLEEESEENSEALGAFGSPDEIGLVVCSYLDYYEDLKDISLWNSDADELQAYAEAVMEDFEEDHPVYLGTFKAGDVPFVLIKAANEEGEYLYADTITNGYAVVFIAYVTDYDGEKLYPVTDEYAEQLKTILATFKPAA